MENNEYATFSSPFRSQTPTPTPMILTETPSPPIKKKRVYSSPSADAQRIIRRIRREVSPIKIYLDQDDDEYDDDDEAPQKKLLNSIDIVYEMFMEEMSNLKTTPAAIKAEWDKKVTVLMSLRLGCLTALGSFCKDNRALGKLRREAERAKRALSSQLQVHVEIESLFDGVDLSEPLTQARFEELNNDLIRKTMGLVKKAMEDAGLQKSQIDEIVLVGGSTTEF